MLAYHDELTGIRGRRAFNESLLSLDQQYAIAIVDIDHFKKFNDAYGHDVGDQVLCMVAKRLSQVGGDGQAFRCEAKSSPSSSATPPRKTPSTISKRCARSSRNPRSICAAPIEEPKLKPRERPTQSAEKSGNRRAGESDRRKPTKKKAAGLRRDGRIRPSCAAPPRANQQPDHLSDHISVTVSIGVAEPSTRYRQPEQVIQAADQALYRAKNKGRNRVELASTAPLRLAERNRAKASRL